MREDRFSKFGTAAESNRQKEELLEHCGSEINVQKAGRPLRHTVHQSSWRERECKKSFPVVSSWHHRSMKSDFVVTCLFTIALTVAGHGAPVRNWQTEKVVTLTVVCGQRYCSSLFAVS